MPAVKQSKKLTLVQPLSVHERIRKAAALRGMSLTSYVNSVMERDATETIEHVRRRELSQADQKALAELLLTDAEPNEALKRAAARHRRKNHG